MSSGSQAVARCRGVDAEAGTAGNSTQGGRIAGREAANLLLLQRPAGLDRVEVVRVGRQIEHANASSSAERSNTRVVVSREVVEDEHVSAPQLREQLLGEPLDEPLLVRAREHRGQENPTGEAHRAEQGEVLAPVHRNAIHELLATLHPRVAAAHGYVHPRLVEEDQAIERDAADLAQERFALFDDVGAQTLQRPSALFFTTYP